MRRASWWAFVVLCVGAAPATGAPPAGRGEAFHVVPAHARLGPGESFRFRIAPPGQADAGVRWSVEGRGVIGRDGTYRAPYVVAEPGERVRILAGRGPRTAPVSADVTVDLTAGAFPGVEDCLGADQQWEANGATLGYVYVEELPEAITKVSPRYPASARARDLQGTVLVNALLCRSGRVIDASAQWGEGVAPVPDLEELAIEAVRQWVFKPGLNQGQPVACMVAVPIRFPPP